MSSLRELNSQIYKLFRRPNINSALVLIICIFLLLIYYIVIPYKNTFNKIISSPLVIIFILVVICIGYFNISIAILVSILFLFTLYNIISVSFPISGTLEHFNSDKKNSNNRKKILKQKEENDKKIDNQVNNIKNVILGTINKFKNTNDSDYKQALLENKQQLYSVEKSRNTNIRSNHIADKFDDIQSNTISKNKPSSYKSSNKSKTSKRGKEDFQTIELRTFDPSSEEDTNLLITKEILQDMHNRIEYNYENHNYLKKYIKHRIEEIVDINKLLDDE